jgi:F-type H+-transporting ATPase subunit a
MNITGPGIYFTIPIFGGIPITQTAVSSFLVMVLLCTAGVLLGRNLKKRPGRLQVVTEKGVSMITGLVCDAMGAHNKRWTPYIAALFLSSLCGSLIGMTGIFRSTTADLSTTATWAIMTSLICWYQSIKNFGLWSWLKGFSEPIKVMTPMNIVSEIAQPVSLAFRHFGNVAGGGVITTMIYWALSGASAGLLRLAGSSWIGIVVTLALAAFLLLVPIKGKKPGKFRKILGIVMVALAFFGLLQLLGILDSVPFLQVGVPAVLSLYFDCFSGLIQAFVFSLLSMIYISNACPAPEEQQPKE